MLKKEILDKLTPITEEEQRILDGEKDVDLSLYTDGSSDAFSGRKLLETGKTIAVRVHTRFVRFPAHSHDYVEVVYVCQGSVTHIISGVEITLREGELLFLSPNEKHEVLPAGENDIAVNFIIAPSFFADALKFSGQEKTPLQNFIIERLNGEKSRPSYLRFEVSDILPIQNLTENLIWTLIYGSPNKRSINQATMGLLFINLLNFTDRISGPDDQSYSLSSDGLLPSDDESVVLFSLQYIEEKYRDGSLTELSKLLHYDFTWLSRTIKMQTGKTYTELVQEKRLSQAIFLLKNTDMTISRIANETGYDNVGYFHRLFQRTFGVSPKKYRDSYK